jgi:hypothetical protein
MKSDNKALSSIKYNKSSRKTFPKNNVVDVIDEIEKGKPTRAVVIVAMAKYKRNRNRLSTIAEDD